MGPQTGSTGSVLSIRSNLVGGRFNQNGPQDRPPKTGPPRPGASAFSGFLARFGPWAAAKFPQTPKNPVNREVRPQEAEPSKVQNVLKLRNANAVPVGQKIPRNPRWRRVTAETAPCRKHMVQPGPEPGTCRKQMVQPVFEPGTSTSLGGGPPRPKEPVNRKLPGKRYPTSSA